STEKAKVVRLAYADNGVFRKAWLVTYGDGPEGRQNIYARHSFDDGASWSAPVLLSRDAAGEPTGGQVVTTRDGYGLPADNDKPGIFAPPVTSGPKVMIAWNSAYCPPDPAAAGNAGSYASTVQGTGDLDGDAVPDRPYHCVWVATTTDPALATWDVQQLTNGQRDAVNEVMAGSAGGNAFALAWQEDPAGLQPGEAEGRGDGGSGAHVTGGTNIWYAHAPSPDGAVLRARIVKLSDNDVAGTGQPGASRPNLQISGSTAVLAYEESSCPGGSGGKCIVYHSFGAADPDTSAAGTIVSDVTRNARRVRFVLQGATAAGASGLRAVLLWRESPVVAPAAPADIMLRRGVADAAARPGSTGLRPDDILADAPQNMTRVAATGGNANAHRAIVRGSFVGLAYDLTPDMAAADPEATPAPTANYNLFFARSVADGAPGSWSEARNLSGLAGPDLTVVEPRMVPTPGTIVNPLTGVPDAGDVQNGDVFYVAFATESNARVGESGRVYLSRSTDRGASFEPFVPVGTSGAGQSESQLRPAPDGSSTLVLWMDEQAPGDPRSKDAMFAIVDAVELPDLQLAAAGEGFTAGGQRTLTLTLRNGGTGAARAVELEGSLPDGLHAVGIGSPSLCRVAGSVFRCSVPEIPAGGERTVSLTVASATEGRFVVSASVGNELPDADEADNVLAFALDAAAAPPEPELPPVTASDGGGCSMVRGDAPFDPSLWLLAGLALAGLAPRRAARSAPYLRSRTCAPERAAPAPGVDRAQGDRVTMT
ncbi:MAG: JDVT-CTERM domain-containing protein, partial [Alphaproteobacteria bacterium]